jgi:hypothetical protein
MEMKSKNILTIGMLSCCLFFNAATAQSKQKAEKAFLHQLNTILKNAKQQHWNFEGTMTIDTAFAINKEGILSVTVRYTNDTSFVRTRLEAPVNKIKRVAYDLYLILEYEDELVTFYVSEPGSNELKENGKTNLFHIGAPLGEDVKAQEKLQRALDELLKYYKN